MTAQINILDKNTQEVIGEISLDSNNQMLQKLKMATDASVSLRNSSADERRNWLIEVKDKILENYDRFVDLLVKEAGKPVQYSRGEVDRSIITLELAIDECRRFCGEKINVNYAAGVGRQAHTLRIPRGVILGLSPFNFPLNLTIHKLAPALASGNTLLLKPSERTPLIAELLQECVDQTSLPKGSFQVSHLSIEQTQSLIENPKVKMVSFTGSPKVGFDIKKRAYDKMVTLELGGDAAVVISSSAELEKAAKKVAIGSYLYAGQICISTQRIFVHQDVIEEFRKLLISEISKLKISHSTEEGNWIGPLISPQEKERVCALVDDALKKGAKKLYEMETKNLGEAFLGPVLLDEVPADARLCHEEVFGPVAYIIPFQSREELCDSLNKSRYGLQAGVFTNALDEFQYYSNHLEVGGIIFNDVPGFRVDGMPYGGVKQSGFGREGIRYAMEEMTEPRLIVY